MDGGPPAHYIQNLFGLILFSPSVQITLSTWYQVLHAVLFLFQGEEASVSVISWFSLVSAGPLIFTSSFLLSFHPHLQEAPPSSRSSTAWDCTSSPFFMIFQELLFGHHDNSHPNPNTVIFYPIYGISFLALPLPWSLPLLFYLPPLSWSLC